MLASAIKVRFEQLRTLGFADVGAFYTAVGNPSANPIRMLRIVNTTNQNILVSFDDIDDYDFVYSLGDVLYNFGSNKIDPAGIYEMPQNTTVYVRYQGATAPTSGNVYVMMIYASTK
jgi:hypothetical protein